MLRARDPSSARSPATRAATASSSPRPGRAGRRCDALANLAAPVGAACPGPPWPAADRPGEASPGVGLGEIGRGVACPGVGMGLTARRHRRAHRVRTSIMSAPSRGTPQDGDRRSRTLARRRRRAAPIAELEALADLDAGELGHGRRQRRRADRRARGPRRPGRRRARPRLAEDGSRRPSSARAGLLTDGCSNSSRTRCGDRPPELEHQNAASSAHRQTLTGQWRVLTFPERATNGAARNEPWAKVDRVVVVVAVARVAKGSRAGRARTATRRAAAEQTHPREVVQPARAPAAAQAAVAAAVAAAAAQAVAAAAAAVAALVAESRRPTD
jgi:hypothetical protein